MKVFNGLLLLFTTAVIMSEPLPAYQSNHSGQLCRLNLFSILSSFCQKEQREIC